MNRFFLSYIVDRFGNEEARLVVRDEEGQSEVISPQGLSELAGEVITFKPEVLLESLRRSNYPCPTRLVGIEEALRLQSQLAKDQGGERYWDFWVAAGLVSDRPDSVSLLAAIFDARVPWPDAVQIDKLLVDVGADLAKVWLVLRKEMDASGESERFFALEIPVRQIFLHRQYKGLALDLPALQGLRESCENEKYVAFRKISSVLNINLAGLKTRDIARLMFEQLAPQYSSLVEMELLDDYLEILSVEWDMAAALLSYAKANRDLAVLRRLGVTGQRVYPLFDCHGTVTSRIMVREPRLQQLRRRYRSVLKADEGKSLIYLDYSQFEPGVLASLSADTYLIEAYNSSDLYATLATMVYGDVSKRPTAKKVFLSYCYGMSIERIAALLSGDTGDKADYSELVSVFFSQFSGVSEFRAACEEKLLAQGSIDTLFGNGRARTSKGGSLLPKERRWAMNHVIQGTASLIFKEALQGINDAFGSDVILLPVHDAVLLQFEAGDVAAPLRAQEIMMEAMKRRCPRIVPKVSTQGFAEW